MRTALRTALLTALLCVGLTAVESPQAVEKADARKLARNKASAHRTVVQPAKAKVSVIARKRPANIQLPSRAAPSRILAVKSGSALVIEQGGDPLFEKNADAIAPIASITKLMTAMVVLDSEPNLLAPIAITEDDVDLLRGSRSRLHVGSVMTRETALLLALMSSENRAANALARHYPGGMLAFLAAMNVKARALGMSNTHFDDPTGLTSNNVSTAHDVARMVAAAHRYPLIRQWSTMPEASVEVNGRDLSFHNTNPLVKSTAWDVGLSKTGYIHEAGKCLVMQARLADRPVVIVLLDSVGKLTRVGDANRIKRWMESVQARLPGHTQAARKPATHAVLTRENLRPPG